MSWLGAVVNFFTPRFIKKLFSKEQVQTKHVSFRDILYEDEGDDVESQTFLDYLTFDPDSLRWLMEIDGIFDEIHDLVNSVDKRHVPKPIAADTKMADVERLLYLTEHDFKSLTQSKRAYGRRLLSRVKYVDVVYESYKSMLQDKSKSKSKSKSKPQRPPCYDSDDTEKDPDYEQPDTEPESENPSECETESDISIEYDWRGVPFKLKEQPVDKYGSLFVREPTSDEAESEDEMSGDEDTGNVYSENDDLYDRFINGPLFPRNEPEDPSYVPEDEEESESDPDYETESDISLDYNPLSRPVYSDEMYANLSESSEDDVDVSGTSEDDDVNVSGISEDEDVDVDGSSQDDVDLLASLILEDVPDDRTYYRVDFVNESKSHDHVPGLPTIIKPEVVPSEDSVVVKQQIILPANSMDAKQEVLFMNTGEIMDNMTRN